MWNFWLILSLFFFAMCAIMIALSIKFSSWFLIGCAISGLFLIVSMLKYTFSSTKQSWGSESSSSLDDI